MDNGSSMMPDEEQELSQRKESKREQPPPRESGRVERQLSQYGFTREEREREVRLTVRDVAADEVAMSFRAAGATLITVTGERAARRGEGMARGVNSGGDRDVEEDGDEQPPHRLRRDATSTAMGELTLRYFYALGETVYTVSIETTSEVVASVAGVYPVATLPEQELQGRLGVVFRGGMG